MQERTNPFIERRLLDTEIKKKSIKRQAKSKLTYCQWMVIPDCLGVSACKFYEINKNTANIFGLKDAYFYVVFEELKQAISLSK